MFFILKSLPTINGNIAWSIYLTKEVFRFDVCDDGVTRLFIGTKTNNIGYLSFKSHRRFTEPKSIYIRKEAGQYSFSFCFDDGAEEPVINKEHLEYLKGSSKEWLEEYAAYVDRGVDRGVAIPVHYLLVPTLQRGNAYRYFRLTQ
ncbi:hypothetical protein [Endozoicomonas sp.]|uniref:hypothetical protein n=1 Tax=Endozoicomonas sp. TaxID=1892382 RepID=UPI00288853B1|nr:hypothetical protein [Endozoicomonas sp.]